MTRSVVVVSIAILVGLLCLTLLSSKADAARLRSRSHVQHRQRHRAPPRHETLLDDEPADRAGLFFRAMDTNHAGFVDEQDFAKLESMNEVLGRYMAGADKDGILSFIELADTDSDNRLTRDEFLGGIAVGMQDETASSFIEARAATGDRRFFRRIVSGIRRAVRWVRGLFSRRRAAPKPKPKPKPKAKAQPKEEGIKATEDGCVVCQYLVERMESNVRSAGIFATMNSIDPNWQSDLTTPSTASFLELDSNIIPAATLQAQSTDQREAAAAQQPSMLEARAEAEQMPFQVMNTGSISATRQATHLQRQLERQKYNEIYRVVDITLDDACEQGMPNSFYRYCKDIYTVQSDIVDGLRYQYRPQDICYKVKLYADGSYITKGIHSRYKKKQESTKKPA